MILGVRQFKMLNANGQEYDMTRPEALFYKPDGLGWGEDASVEAVGLSYVLTEKKPQKPNPKGSMVFRNYQEYQVFLEFLQVGGLVLCYKPIDTWYYLDVTATIGKSEIDDKTRHLECPMTFSATSGWYKKVVAYQAQGSGAGKTYSYTYPYTYTSSAAGSVDIPNGNLPSYPKITIFGPVTNPFWALYQNGNRLETGRVNATIPDGHKLVIDCHPATMEIAEYTNIGEFVANRYADSDFTTARLFMLPAGPCSVVFTQDGTGVADAFVEVKARV